MAKEHYQNYEWEDESKRASHFVYYNLYSISANVASPYESSTSQKTRQLVWLEYLRKSQNIVSTRSGSWNSCAEPAIHNLNFKLFKDQDIFIDSKIDFIHCGNTVEIISNGKPYILVAFPYWTVTVEIDYM